VENALFYTFSTIAQTLAAAIAFLGAFALYRFQSIEVSLDEMCIGAIQPYLPDEELANLAGMRKYSELSNRIRNIKPKPPNQPSSYQVGQKIAYHSYTDLLIELKRQLSLTLVITVFVIVSSVVIITLVPKIKDDFFITNTIFILGILFFILCLSLHARFVAEALEI
jgi:hypothetical protein